MTLKYIEIHCGLIDSPGMLGVAIGRAQSSTGLNLVNFTPLAVVPPLPDDVSFSLNPTHNTQKSSKCCTCLPLPSEKMQDEGNLLMDTEDWDIEPDQEMLDEIDKFVLSVVKDAAAADPGVEDPPATPFTDIPASDTHSEPKLPKDFDVKVSLELQKYKEVTDYHRQYNILLDNLKDSDVFASGLATIYSEISEQHKKLIPGTSAKNPSEETKFQKWLAEYFSSDGYHQICKKVFGPGAPTDKELDIIWRMVYALSSVVAVERELTSNVPDSSQNPRYNPDRFSTSGVRGKLRYIVGYVVFALRKDLTRKLRGRQQYKSLTELQDWDKAHSMLLLARLMWRSPDQVLAETQDIESLEEIQRRQYIGQGLTNVSDSTFFFFKDLCIACLKLMDSKTIASHHEDAHKFIYNSLITDTDLEQKWHDIFSKQIIMPQVTNECVASLHKESVAIFTRTMMRQWRRDIIGGITKKTAHQKEISKSTSSLKKKVAIATTSDDQAEDVHAKLSHMLTSQLSKFLKNDILTLCQAYNINKLQTTTKKVLVKDLEEALRKSTFTPSKDKLIGLSASAHHILGSSPATKYKKTTPETDLDTCKVCNSADDLEDDKWIQCDQCDR